ncbi:Transcription initiation factor IIB 2 [Bienertia sinuspersici]
MESLMPGPKRYMRAWVWTKLGKPLVPGCYIEYEPNNLIWVDFRYEGVFHICKNCGIIGHDTVACRRPRDLAEQDINGRIAAYSPLTMWYLARLTDNSTQTRYEDFQILHLSVPLG